jgi:hypothetical protein
MHGIMPACVRIFMKLGMITIRLRASPSLLILVSYRP